MRRKKLNETQLGTAFRILGSVLLCASLFFVVMMLGKVGQENMNIGEVGAMLGGSIVIFALYEAGWFIHARKRENKYSLFRIGYIVLDIAAATLSFLSAVDPVCFGVGGALYLCVPIVKRVASIVKNTKKRNVILNVLIGIVNVLLLAVAVLCLEDKELEYLLFSAVVGIVILMTCLFNIGTIVFSHFKIETMRKIIRKTYAGEILFGMLLLIVAFSMALMTMEPSITTFSDAMWYCFAIVTTIGFGDITAVTFLGRILSVVLGIYGLVVVAIVTSIIVNFYNEVKEIRDEEEETVEQINRNEMEREKKEKEDKQEKID